MLSIFGFNKSSKKIDIESEQAHIDWNPHLYQNLKTTSLRQFHFSNNIKLWTHSCCTTIHSLVVPSFERKIEHLSCIFYRYMQTSDVKINQRRKQGFVKFKMNEHAWVWTMNPLWMFLKMCNVSELLTHVFISLIIIHRLKLNDDKISKFPISRENLVPKKILNEENVFKIVYDNSLHSFASTS